MKKNVLTKSIRILIIVLLLLTVLVPRVLSQKLMIAASIIWLISLLAFYLYQNHTLSLMLNVIKNAKTVYFPKQAVESVAETADSSEYEEQTIPDPVPFVSNQDTEQEVMLQHIALRITDKLKSAYPDATWKFKTEPSLQGILGGTTHRIIVDGMEKYTHADISFDKFARIHIEPLILGKFKPAATADGKSPDIEEKEPAVVDVSVWYELIGQTVLQKQITELNCKGHSKLTVKENGDIVIRKQGKDLLQTSLESFPAKNYWQEIIDLLETDELKGKISGETLQISWN